MAPAAKKAKSAPIVDMSGKGKEKQVKLVDEPSDSDEENLDDIPLSKLPKGPGQASKKSPSRSPSKEPAQTEPPHKIVHISPEKPQSSDSAQLEASSLAPEAPEIDEPASSTPDLSFTEQIIKKRRKKMIEDRYPELAIKPEAREVVLDVLTWRDIRLKKFEDFGTVLEQKRGIRPFLDYEIQMRKLASWSPDSPGATIR